jgi:hypothetical protein
MASLLKQPPLASLFEPRPVRVWVVLGLFVLYLIVSYGIFFETIAPVANFSVQPIIAADSGIYWEASGARPVMFKEHPDLTADPAGNLFGPVLEAKALRTDFNVCVFNCLLFMLCLWVLRSMPEFDRTAFLLLMMANPFLIAALISLNKEVFALTGIILFIRYTRANRFRFVWLTLALTLSLFARWQQVLVMLIYVALESRLSPFRKRRRWGLAATILVFTVGYGAVYRIVPTFFAALLAQAEAGHTILVLDRIQANFGFPIVVAPKILMNCLGRWSSPSYFLHDYIFEDFTNWRDNIFMQVHTLLLTCLLAGMLLSRKLSLRHNTVYLLALYLVMTAVNPMVQPRYEYAAYVLLCLEASRHFRIGERGGTRRLAPRSDESLAPSLG